MNLQALDFSLLLWLFALAVTLHMLEEVIWLPGWSQEAGAWHEPVSGKVFGLATAVFLFFLYALTLWGSGALGVGQGGTAVYLLCGLALVMLANVVLPHLGATIAQRRYAPGLATGLLFNLPAALLLLAAFFARGSVPWARFLLTAGLMVVTAVLVWPLLFRLARRVVA